jgi:hypothetical protein
LYRCVVGLGRDDQTRGDGFCAKVFLFFPTASSYDAPRIGVCPLKHTFAFPCKPAGACRLRVNVVERVKKFLRADAGGAEFAHHYAGGGVREHGRVGQRRSRSSGKG